MIAPTELFRQTEAAVKMRQPFSNIRVKPGKDRPERWNGYDDRNGIGSCGAGAWGARGGGKAVRPGALRRMPGDGPGPGGRTKRADGPAGLR